jgi:predicted TIM-barrel fold metal-dependent hydrolase
MSTRAATPSATVRGKLKHPVIDGDGHTLEFNPAVLEYIKAEGGADMYDVASVYFDTFKSSEPNLHERKAQWLQRTHFWINSSRDERDRATLHLPRLLNERMDELGIDFMVVYPSLGLTLPGIANYEFRRAACRALNRLHADLFREFSHRMCPVMVVPMNTPEEAIEALEYGVQTLGFKVALMAGSVPRALPHLGITRPDFYGIDSEHDYDPFWRRCLELRVALTVHDRGFVGRPKSPTSFVYQHIGMFANAHHELCKSLFLGGVTKRFPALRLAFLEGGVGWAAMLLSDLVGHWTGRNKESVLACDPSRLRGEEMVRLFREYGGTLFEKHLDKVKGHTHIGDKPPDPESAIDEFALCGIERVEDIRDRFVPNFFFGCEADDGMTSVAFDPKLVPFGARLSAFFGSDVGHWDTPDISAVLAEAYELVEHELLNEADFSDFVFGNAARFYAGTNTRFFEGTAVADAVADVLRKH